ncbi:MAG: hypothetical protein CMP32_04490 [Rickettsiales bacterium]|nr:hypothetical protein [Rickettsiales bacterium]
MDIIINSLIVICLITTFLVLVIGLFHTARSHEDEDNKVNKFMKYRVAIQFVTLIILTFALFFKS